MGAYKRWLEEQEDERSDPDYEYWQFLKSYVPEEPAQRYQLSIEQLDELIEGASHLASYPMFHRMLLVQHVAVIEAYLADRLVKIASLHDSARKNLVLNHQPLKGQKYSLEAIVGNRDLVVDKIDSYLKSILYHELTLVDEVYKAAIGVSIFVDESSAAELKDIMIKRHHCVHRDGKDNFGRVLDEIDGAFVKKSRNLFVGLFNNIEELCKAWAASHASPLSATPSRRTG